MRYQLNRITRTKVDREKGHLHFEYTFECDLVNAYEITLTTELDYVDGSFPEISEVTETVISQITKSELCLAPIRSADKLEELEEKLIILTKRLEHLIYITETLIAREVEDSEGKTSQLNTKLIDVMDRIRDSKNIEQGIPEELINEIDELLKEKEQ